MVNYVAHQQSGWEFENKLRSKNTNPLFCLELAKLSKRSKEKKNCLTNT